MDDPADAAMHAYYALGGEQDRLSEGDGVVEFERTKEILLRHLPDPPAVVADIGGGPGRYALWLAGRGHRVEHRDLVALHVDQLRAAGLEVVDLVAVEGLAFALSDLDERMADPVGRAVVLDAARAIERVPELLGLGPHLLATTRRPTG
jgi:hypothetical protein